MGSDGIAKVQHYVPQFLLRNFGAGKKHQFNVFDKVTQRIFRTNARNVAGESRFYDFDYEGHKFTIEPSLSAIESKAKPLLQKVIDNDSVGVLTAEDRAVLSVFFSVQFTRTRAFKEQWRSLPRLLEERLQRTAKGPHEYEALEEYIRVPDKNETTIETVRFIQQAPQKFSPYFANKVWILLKTEPHTPYLIGDNPLALQNSIDMGPHGNIGIGVKGIEIYFPLSPVHALAMWCSSHAEELQRAVNNLRAAARLTRVMDASQEIALTKAEQLWTAMEEGSPLQAHPENVVNFNSLQIRYAERYVFSCGDDFSLARKMIEDNPAVRMGPRVSIA